MFDKRKYFFVSMISTLMIISLGLGMAIVEKNAQNVISSDKTPFLTYNFSGITSAQIKIHFIGKDFIFYL